MALIIQNEKYSWLLCLLLLFFYCVSTSILNLWEFQNQWENVKGKLFCDAYWGNCLNDYGVIIIFDFSKTAWIT